MGDKYDLEDRLVDFAVEVIEFTASMPRCDAGKYISGQLLRSGTAPAPHYGEAQGAESRRDFIHKMRVGLKELRESRVWMKIILRKGDLGEVAVVSPMFEECEELIRIFVSSVRTAEDREKKGGL